MKGLSEHLYKFKFKQELTQDMKKFDCKLALWSSYGKVKRGYRQYRRPVIVISRRLLGEIEDLVGKTGRLTRDGNRLIVDFS